MAKKESGAINRIEIDLGAFRRNLGRIRGRLKGRARMLVVVKSEAYGHGMVPLAKEAEKVPGVVYLGVSTASEAFRLREAGVRLPVLILGVVHPDQAADVVRAGVTATVSSLEEARHLDRTARRLKRRAKVHVELDTGMGRLGVWCAEAIWFIYKVNEMKNLEIEGLYTHFPSADDDDPKFSTFQIEVFDKAVDLSSQILGRRPAFVHMANSMGLVTYRDSHFTLVRPGIMAYGINPSRREPPLDLKPVLTLKSRVAFIKSVGRGRSISYARSYVTEKPTRIATVPLGYSSGYPFQLSNKSRVLVGGKSYPVVGRITMDHIMVDVGEDSRVRKWDEVVLIGRSGKERVRAEELAAHAGTIPYDVLCGLSLNLPRIYKH